MPPDRRTAHASAGARRPLRARRASRRSTNGAAAPSAQSAYTSRTVSLNWRTLPKPAANAMSVIDIEEVSISTRAVCARCAPRQRERSGTELVGDEARQVTAAVPEPAGETGDALAVDDAVGDEAHRPGNDVAAHVPFGRAGRGVGTATLARPEPVLLGGRRRREELHVGALGGDRRAARAAVDARRADGDVEPAVEPRVAALGDPVALVGVELDHTAQCAGPPADPDERKSDITVERPKPDRSAPV